MYRSKRFSSTYRSSPCKNIVLTLALESKLLVPYLFCPGLLISGYETQKLKSDMKESENIGMLPNI